MSKSFTGLTAAERDAVAAAVGAAERTTSGEIFCIVARRSGHFREVPLAYAAGAALVLPLLALIAGWTPHWPFTGWVAQSDRLRLADAITAYAAVQAVLFAVVALATWPAQVRAVLTPRALKVARVRAAATEQFLAKGLHLTAARTGVLIYASLAEHRVEVVADEGIHAKVEAEVWGDVMDALVRKLKTGDPAAGFVDAVRLCGEILARHFPPRPGDVNELADRIVEI